MEGQPEELSFYQTAAAAAGVRHETSRAAAAVAAAPRCVHQHFYIFLFQKQLSLLNYKTHTMVILYLFCMGCLVSAK